jgi:hypothetical protein
MKFSAPQEFLFNADKFHYSIVTVEERNTSQLSVTYAVGDSNMVISAVGASSIPMQTARGSKTSLHLWKAPIKTTPIELTINFPKKSKKVPRVYGMPRQVLNP